MLVYVMQEVLIVKHFVTLLKSAVYVFLILLLID